MRRRNKKKAGRASAVHLEDSEIVKMEPQDYVYVAQNLAKFWSNPGKSSDLIDGRSMVALQELHNVKTYYQFDVTSIVQKNTKGEVESYLVGYICPSDTAYAVVHSYGAVPERRDPSYVAALFDQFSALCVKREVQFIRIVINPAFKEEIEVYKSVGFSAELPAAKRMMLELEGETVLVKAI